VRPRDGPPERLRVTGVPHRHLGSGIEADCAGWVSGEHPPPLVAFDKQADEPTTQDAGAACDQDHHAAPAVPAGAGTAPI
jgi:hypothetical protein